MNDTTTETQPKAYSYSYAGNAGDRRRSQLAYLIAEQRRYDEQQVGYGVPPQKERDHERGHRKRDNAVAGLERW